MKDSGNSFHARHLKRALDYVMNPEKTQGGRLVGAINCQADMAFEQMMDTKKQFGKTDKRQGYHIILSFKEDEVEPDRAFEITQKFVAEYLGDAYEAVFVVHDNTDHVHSHIVFNSVSFVVPTGARSLVIPNLWKPGLQGSSVPVSITATLCAAGRKAVWSRRIPCSG